MASRLSLHTELCTLLGSSHVYFQPPETVKLEYPCIIYTRDGADEKRADDKIYNHTFRYTVTLIDKNPDSTFVNTILLGFEHISYDRHFASDNLNHDVYTLYY